MKKLLLLLLLSMSGYAQTVHRVTNGMNLQTVIDNAVNGDVILVEAGSHGDIYVNKSVSIIGTGYFNQIQNAVIQNLYLNGSGSYLTGLEIANEIFVGTSNIIIEKIKINSCQLARKNISPTSGTVNENIENILIKKCLINNLYVGSLANGIPSGIVSNSLVANNILTGEFHINGSHSFSIFKNTFKGSPIYITQSPNISFVSNLFFSNADLVANSYYSIYKPSVHFYYNYCNGFTNSVNTSPFGLKNTIGNTNGAELLVGFPSNPNNLQEDARYQLAPNSPARGAGENGTDCGAFGGDDPYVLGGIPDIPSIYYLNVQPSVPQGGTLNVQIKAKTNN